MQEQISRTCPSSGAKPARMGASSRMSSLDVMKCFAAFCVVWIHYGTGWLSPIVRCAVPIFFVITGYYYPVMVEKGNFWRHIRKLLVMVLCASAMYGVVEFQHQIRQDTLQEWVQETLRLRHILGLIVYDNDMFGFHLWYFWAVLYDLTIFYLADKWKLTRFLRILAPLLLLVFFVGNFTPWYGKCRNFLFMGLPCMMTGRLIRENSDGKFSFLSNGKYLWAYVGGALMLVCCEMLSLHFICSDRGIRDMYIFTLPLFLPLFYYALKHPHFGEGTFWATIGSKYSAYIYIFHVLAARFLGHIVARDASLLTKSMYPFVVFGISLCMSWAFVKILKKARPHRV